MSLRLAYVTARAPFGRDELFVMEELRALLGRGHFVHIMPLLPSGEPAHGLAHELMAATEARWPWSPAVLGAAAREFVRAPRRSLRALTLLLTWHPRNLLANLIVYPKALWLARRARELGIQHIHAHWATTTAAMAMAAAHVAQVPWSFTAHSYDLHRNDLFARKARRAAFARTISRDGERLARRMCGPLARSELDRGHGPLPQAEEKIVRLPMGVPVNVIPAPLNVIPAKAGIQDLKALDARFRGHDERPRLLCVARLMPHKGHRELLEAFAKVMQPAELWLAGSGPERAAIHDHIQALGLTNVRLLGYLPNEHLLELYRRRVVDAVILASTCEGIPVSLMEAMAAGLPVIATGVGGIPELLWGGAGKLVPPGDTPALAWAIEELLRDPMLRARLGNVGRARIARRFSIDRTTELLEACFAAHIPGAKRSAPGILKRTRAAYRPTYAAPISITPASSARSARHPASAHTEPPTTRGPA